MVMIVKASGEREEFNKQKIISSVISAGGSREVARKVAEKVARNVRENMRTEQILKMTLGFLKETPEIAARYDLKRAIMSLGPHGFLFEEFFAQVLNHYGYKTNIGVIVKGKVVEQEIDIVAERKLKYMIEAKYHNHPGIYTDTKVAMYTYARFLDIKSNPKNKFDKPILVTNTKCTDRAIGYSRGVGLKVIAWKYPKKNSLLELIDRKGLYPITIFKSVSDAVKEKLFRLKIVLAKDLMNYELKDLVEKTGLSEQVIKRVLDEAKGL